MPPSGNLTASAIADLTEWVKRGAPWPKEQQSGVAARDAFDLQQRKRNHWAWQPIRATPPPRVRDLAWARTPIDAFVLAKLEASGLKPAEAADRRTLLRRVTFDLIGLPPSPQEIESFLKDESPQAFGKAVDRLRHSPSFPHPP